MSHRLLNRRVLVSAAIALLLPLAACGPQGPASVSALNKPPGIANLMKERLRGELTSGRTEPGPFKFPARVRVLPYDYQTGLHDVDMLAQLDGFAETLRKHPDLVSDASVLPEAYGESIGASFDGLMKLAGSLRADVFLLVSGRARFIEASEQGVGLFDWWARKSNWEAHATLDALWVEAPSGRFLPSLQAAAKAGPMVVAAHDESASSSAYAMRRQVESQAFKRLGEALAAQLRAERLAAPSPEPTASGVIGADAQATDTPEPEPTASASAMAGQDSPASGT